MRDPKKLIREWSPILVAAVYGRKGLCNSQSWSEKMTVLIVRNKLNAFKNATVLVYGRKLYRTHCGTVRTLIESVGESVCFSLPTINDGA